MKEQRVEMIELGRLRAHAMNSNVMKEGLLEKLVEHIRGSGQYPPLIVRRVREREEVNSERDEGANAGRGVYQVLDGHHRWRALERLGVGSAACVVWEADDAEAMVLLATLNRLQGQDDPRKRGALLAELQERFGKTVKELGRCLPEAREDLKKLLEVGKRVKLPGLKKVGEAGLPGAVVFFLDAVQREKLDRVLGEMGGTREAGLMAMVERVVGE